MDKKIIKVAQIIGQANAGGVESCIMNYYKHIDRSKIHFSFFVENTCDIINKKTIEELGGEIVIIPPYKKVFKYYKFLKKAFINGKFDIVHSNMNTLSVFSLKAAKKAKIKIRIAHSHSTANIKEGPRVVLKYLLRPFSKVYATHFFACSKYAGEWLFGKKITNQLTIINNAIDLDRFKFKEEVRNRIREELNLSGYVVLGNVGRFMAQKNQLFLLDVFSEYHKINPKSVLLLVGDGPLREKIVSKAKELDVFDKLVLTGNCPNPEDYYQAMDIFVFPSIFEGLGMALVEAQINGLPCYVSDKIPAEAIVTDNVFAIELNKGARFWAQQISSHNNSRKDELDAFKNSKFDLVSEAQKLEEKYIEMMRDEKNEKN